MTKLNPVEVLLQVVEDYPAIQEASPATVKRWLDLFARYAPLPAAEPLIIGPVLNAVMVYDHKDPEILGKLIQLEKQMRECSSSVQLDEKEVRFQGIDASMISWIVNDSGELGVKIGRTLAFLYKGSSLEYSTTHHGDGTPMRWRYVGKREFGECCHPRTMPIDGIDGRYTDGEGWHPMGEDAPPAVHDVDLVGRRTV